MAVIVRHDGAIVMGRKQTRNLHAEVAPASEKKPPRKQLHMDDDLYTKAAHVATWKGFSSLPNYVNNILRRIIEKDYDEFLEAKTDELAKKREAMEAAERGRRK